MGGRFADTKEKKWARLAHTLASRDRPRAVAEQPCSLQAWVLACWPLRFRATLWKGPVSQALTLNLRSEAAHVFIFGT